MNYLFIIDNSYSMTQKSANMLSLLEVAKNFVELFIMTRVKTGESKGEKFFVLSSSVEDNKNLYDFSFVTDIPHVLANLRSIQPS